MCINASQIYLEIDTRRNSSLSESELHGCWLKYCHSKVENLQSCAFYRWFHIELWHQFVCAGKVLDVSLLELLHICFLFTSLIQQDARQQGSWAEMVPNERLDSKNLEGLVCVKAGSQLDFYDRSMQTYQVVRTQTDCIGGWEQSGTERPSQRLGIFVGGRHWHWGVLMSWGFDKGVCDGWCVSSGILMNARTHCFPIEHYIVSRTLLFTSPVSGFNVVADCVSFSRGSW